MLRWYRSTNELVRASFESEHARDFVVINVSDPSTFGRLDELCMPGAAVNSTARRGLPHVTAWHVDRAQTAQCEE